MRVFRWTLMVLCLMALVGVAPANAQDRTDVVDGVWGTVSTLSQSTGASTLFRINSDVLVVNGSGGSDTFYARHRRVGGTSQVGGSLNGGAAVVILYMYEPEKIGRKGDQAKLSQKTQLAAVLAIAASGSVAVVTSRTIALGDGCGMKAQGKGTDDANPTNSLKIKAKCKDLTVAMGMTADEETALLRILGVTELTDKSLALKTKTALFLLP